MYCFALLSPNFSDFISSTYPETWDIQEISDSFLQHFYSFPFPPHLAKSAISDVSNIGFPVPPSVSAYNQAVLLRG